MRDVVVLGSTGSIGVQALQVVAAHPDQLRVVALAAGGERVELLARQALEHGVGAVAVSKATAAQDLQLALYAHAQRSGYSTGLATVPKIFAGPDAAQELATWPADVVLNAITGSVGLAPTLAALRVGHRVALANKESLVAGGALVRAALSNRRESQGSQAHGRQSHDGQGGWAKPQLVPVDSEHTALLQCLRAGRREEVRRLVLTASGGPFRGYSPAQLRDVTPQQALAHPTWQMGPVITVNSATLVNKGLELIEAHELFDVPYDRIDVVVHPESVVHSMVEFCDGSTVAQLSRPDMRLTIGLALAWPDRLRTPEPAAQSEGTGADSAAWDWRASWPGARAWSFHGLDDVVFPAVRLARSAGIAGRCCPAILNAANEECVAAFLQRRLPFCDIVPVLAEVLAAAPSFGEPRTVEDVLTAERWARARANEEIIGRT